jgi:hypothetical protein
MKSSRSSLGLVLALFLAPLLRAQELSPRMGFSAFLTQPSDEAGKLYNSGWKVNLTVHVRREYEVEGRLRFEFGGFGEGKDLPAGPPYSAVRYSARTRLVGYDWLIPLGLKRETPVDLILGLGGAHWYREKRSLRLPAFPPSGTDSDTTEKLAFAGTVGFRWRLTRNVELELHQVLTSLPGSHRDFEDAELSHTALGVGVRF